MEFQRGEKVALSTTAMIWQINAMVTAYSKLTLQGRTTLPKKVRQKLGRGLGAILEWAEEDGHIVARRAARFTSEDIHRAIFEDSPAPRTLAELRRGVQEYVKSRRSPG